MSICRAKGNFKDASNLHVTDSKDPYEVELPWLLSGSLWFICLNIDVPLAFLVVWLLGLGHCTVLFSPHSLSEILASIHITDVDYDSGHCKLTVSLTKSYLTQRWTDSKKEASPFYQNWVLYFHSFFVSCSEILAVKWLVTHNLRKNIGTNIFSSPLFFPFEIKQQELDYASSESQSSSLHNI